MKTPTISVLALVFTAGCAQPLNSKQADEVFGNSIAFDCVQTPDRVEAWRIEWRQNAAYSLSQMKLDNYARLSKPVDVAPAIAQKIARILSRQSTYNWDSHKTCQFLPGVQLRFVKKDQIVDILFCFKCNELGVWHNHQRVGGQEFDKARRDLARLVKQIFPDDKEIQSL